MTDNQQSIEHAFNDTVAYYDDWMRKALPQYEYLFSTAVELIPFAPERPLRVLDLGAGTGLFSWHVYQKFTQAHFVLIDLAEKLLRLAQDRFQGTASQVEVVVQDYRNLAVSEPYDLVISSLSIHHLTDAEKQVLFGRIYHALKSGGVFINVDQIKGPTPLFQELYWRNWLQRVRQNGADEEHIQQSIQRRKTYDQDATLVDQLTWLAAAGFSDVDCIYKNYFIGIFLAEKRETQ